MELYAMLALDISLNTATSLGDGKCICEYI